MSLVNLAIRLCLKRALLNRTYAEDRVFDSKVTPIDEVAVGARQPLITVATDDDGLTGDWGVAADKRDLDIVIEMALADAVAVEVPQPDGQGAVEMVALDIPHTDAALELTLDVMQRQVERALAQPGTEWAELFRHFAGTRTKQLKRRGGDTTQGVKFAARQIVITCTPKREPEYGRAPGEASFWARLLAAMAGDPELARYVPLLASAIEGEALPSWRVLQAAMGWTDAGVAALGPAPVDPTETGEPPGLTEVTLEATTLAGMPRDSRTITDGDRASFEIPT